MAKITMKSYLERVHEAVVDSNNLKALIEYWSARMDISAYSFSGMPGSPNANPDKIPNAVANLLELRSRYEDQYAFEAMLCARAELMFAELYALGIFDNVALRYAELHYLCGIPYQEIADINGKAIGSIRNRVSNLFNADGIDDYVPMDIA